MQLTISSNLSGMARASEIMREEALVALREAAQVAENQFGEDALYGFAGPYVFTRIRTVQVAPDAFKVSSGETWGAIINEGGRRPGAKMAPWNVGSLLFEWVARKIGATTFTGGSENMYRELKSIAFCIARKQAREGVEPTHAAANTPPKVEAQVIEIGNRAAARMAERINGV